MVKILLSNGLYTIVDEEDYDWLNDLSPWHFTNGYARKKEIGYLHRLVLLGKNNFKTLTKFQYADHLNGNKLDNRKINLRIATPMENAHNRRIKNPLGYKGIAKNYHKFIASICVKGKSKYLGSWGSAEEAAEAYNKAAIKYFGKFAYINLIKPKP